MPSIALRLFALTLATLHALPASAAMTGAEFEAYTTGKTLTYGDSGQPYGVERYLPGRRVIWAFTGDDCRYGTWHEEAEQICFLYEDDAEAQCWTFEATPGGLRAHFVGDPDGQDLIEVQEDDGALKCPGPDVGV